MAKHTFLISLLCSFMASSAFAQLSLEDRLEQATKFKIDWRIQELNQAQKTKLEKIAGKLLEDVKKINFPKDLNLIAIEDKTTLYSNGLGIGLDDLEANGLSNIMEQLAAHQNRMKSASDRFGYKISFDFQLNGGSKANALIEELNKAKISNPYSIGMSFGYFSGPTEAYIESNRSNPTITRLHFKKDTTPAEAINELAIATLVNDDLVNSNRRVNSKISFFSFMYKLSELRAATQNLPKLIEEIQARGSRILDKATSIEIQPYGNCLKSTIDESSKLRFCNEDSAERVIALIKKNAEFLGSLSIDLSTKAGWAQMLSGQTEIRPRYELTLDHLIETANKYSAFIDLVKNNLGVENIAWIFIQFGGDSQVQIFEKGQGARIDFNPSNFNEMQFKEQLRFAKQKIGTR